MTRLDAANVIRVFDFYLAAMMVLSLSRRYTVYWEAVALLVRLHGRWPNVVGKLKQHHGVLVTGAVLRPLALAAGLTAVQMVLSRAIFPTATLTVGEALRSGWMPPVLAAAAGPMLAVDAYFLVRVAAFDRPGAEASLDLAEGWLTSRWAPVIRAVTLGRVDPHRMVDDELRSTLAWFGQTARVTAWWVAAQVGCRVLCGTAVWLAWLAGGGR